MRNAANLALVHRGRASSSTQATDDSIKAIDYIIEDHPLGENGPYPFCSTYARSSSAHKDDWWAVAFPYPVRFNAIEFTHGRLDQGGGYWVALDVQVQHERDGHWVSASGQRIFPEYDFRDWRGNRRPLESHAVVFDEVEAVAVRLYGRPGGAQRHTTLSHLGVYHVDASNWDASEVPAVPVPRLFKLLEPEWLAEVVFDLARVTGIMMTAETPVPVSVGLDSYLDWEPYQRFVAQDPRQTTRPDEFERLLFIAEGGDCFMPLLNAGKTLATARQKPLLHIHHGGLCELIVPVVVHGEVIGLLTSCTHFFCDGPDESWHRQHARELGIDEEGYFRSLAQLPILPRGYLEAMLHLLSLLANTMAETADTSLRREQELREMERALRALAERGQQVIGQALSYMDGNLDQPLSLRELASAVGVSPRHLNRLSQEVTGRSPIELLTDRRLDRAADLLRVRGKSVTDVCNEVGYCSVSYFVRLFKRRFGVTPGRYARSAPH